MALFLGSWLAALIVRALNRSIVDDTLDTLIAQGDGQVLKAAHCMHVTFVLFDCLINFVLDKSVEILDLFST
eukprot:9298377-Ditylum_brightwellii.AAC.1